MIIQHNIMAMNAYRNYMGNTNALAKNLEKLSSGYRINRAGDDAAGLAISEKMRAQITGLDAAQKNVQDGISLVQTAEGAMQEVQDMLNRMVYLATQSANGTYDNEVDRANLQKEVDSLSAEINRIADSANFNGIKLLDGSMDANSGSTEIKLNGDAAMAMIGANPGGATDALKNVIYHKDASGASKTSFTVDFTNVDALNYTATADETVKLALTGFQNENVLKNSAGDDTLSVELSGGEKVTAQSLADAVEEAIGDEGTVLLKLGDAAQATDFIEYKVTNNGDGTLTFEMTDDGYATAARLYDADIAAGNVTDGGTTADAFDVFRGSFDVGFYTDDNGTVGTGFGKAYGDGVGGALNGTTKVTEGGSAAGVQLYDAGFDFSGYELKDGGGLQIGDEYYVFATSEKTLNKEYGDNINVIDLTDLADVIKDAEENGTSLTKINKDGTTSNGAAGDTNVMTEIFNRLTVAAKDNRMFKVQAQASGNWLEITERADYTGDADLTNQKGASKVLRTFTGLTEIETVASGEALTLQIGDTADDYNQLQVNIEDMHVDALGIGDIDISTQAGAQAAVDKIKAAINSVSMTRGTLGATQNRLEHTANNLAVMEENIQDAESAIRDTDIAEEMMAYTKNNILIQSAQAMLAQANQVPQGVLQLLQ